MEIKKLRFRHPRKKISFLKKALPIGFVLRHLCPVCGSNLVLRNSKFGVFYSCVKYPSCVGSHSAYQNTGQPMGFPADANLKYLRLLVHSALLSLVKSKNFFTFKDSYLWLSNEMHIPISCCKIGLFDTKLCNFALSLINSSLANV